MGRPKPKPPVEEQRESVIHMKGSREYVEWLDTIHKRTHIPRVKIVRLALAEWAERHGHETPPEI